MLIFSAFSATLWNIAYGFFFLFHFLSLVLILPPSLSLFLSLLFNKNEKKNIVFVWRCMYAHIQRRYARSLAGHAVYYQVSISFVVSPFLFFFFAMSLALSLLSQMWTSFLSFFTFLHKANRFYIAVVIQVDATVLQETLWFIFFFIFLHPKSDKIENSSEI